MTQRQIELEIKASRAATDRIRRDLEKAKDKGYFSSQPFARDFLKQYVLDFSEALQAAVQKTSVGRATTTNIALIYKEMDQIMQYSEADVIAFISIKSIFDALGVRRFDKPKLQDLCMFIGRQIEKQVELDYYLRVATETGNDHVVEAINRELNTKGSGLKNREYGSLYSARALLKKMGWSEGDLFPKWTNYNIGLVGSFVVDIATRQGYLSTEKVSLEYNKKATFIDISQPLYAQFQKYQQKLEDYSTFHWPLIDPPKDWIYQPGLSKLNHTGGYHSEWIRKCGLPLCRNNYDSVFSEDAIKLLNVQQRTAWVINRDVYKVISKCQDRGIPKIGKLASHIRDPRLDNKEPPPKILNLPKDHPDRKAWRKERAALYARNTYLEKRAIRSVQSVAHAKEFLSYERIYFSWSCDYRGRMYSQQKLLQPQAADFEKAMLSFADGCELTERGKHWSAQAIGTAYLGGRGTYQERLDWTYNNQDLITEVATKPMNTLPEWEVADEPWTFLQLSIEWHKVVIAKTKEHWNAPIGVDATASGMQLLSAMRRDPIGMEWTNLLPPETPHSPPKDAYLEVLRLARKESYSNPETQHLTEYLEDRRLGKTILMKTVYGASQSTNREDVKEVFIELGLFENPITYKEIGVITTILLRACKQVFPMAYEALKWFNSLGTEAWRNKATSLNWTTPTNDKIDLIRYKQSKVLIRSHLLGSMYLQTGDTPEADITKSKRALIPGFIHSWDACLMKAAFKDWSAPIALNHDCFFVLPNDIDKALERIKKGFVHVCSGNPLSSLANEVGVPDKQLPRLRQGDADLTEVLGSIYMFN